MRGNVAELAARAQVISQDAGTKVVSAMRDVIGAASGIAGFAIESARDLVQFMVKRGQMTAEEGEKLLREAEQAGARRAGSSTPASPAKAAPAKAAPAKAAPAKTAAARKPATAKAAPKSSAAKPSAKSEKKPAAKKKR